MRRIVSIFLATLVMSVLVGCNSQNTNIKTQSQTNISIEKTCKHSWSTATCTEPAKCTLCSETKGAPLGHRFTDATCTSASKCNVCGIAGATALGHKWTNANCQSPKKCLTCGVVEGNKGSCVDSGNGKCQYCGTDIFLNNIKEKLKIQLIVPKVGADNNYYFQVKYVNHTGSTILLSSLATANGYLCYNLKAKNFELSDEYQIPVSYYNGVNTYKKDMYLDNNSVANTTIEINGKTIHIKFGTQGITDIGYSLSDIDVY